MFFGGVYIQLLKSYNVISVPVYSTFFSIPPESKHSKTVHLLVITSFLGFGLLAKKVLQPDKWDNKSGNDENAFQIEDIPK